MSTARSAARSGSLRLPLCGFKSMLHFRMGNTKNFFKRVREFAKLRIVVVSTHRIAVYSCPVSSTK